MSRIQAIAHAIIMHGAAMAVLCHIAATWDRTRRALCRTTFELNPHWCRSPADVARLWGWGYLYPEETDND